VETFAGSAGVMVAMVPVLRRRHLNSPASGRRSARKSMEGWEGGAGVGGDKSVSTVRDRGMSDMGVGTEKSERVGLGISGECLLT
jgi:hypothetical protein